MPSRGCGGMDGAGEPAFVPDPRVPAWCRTGLLAGVGGRISKGRFEAHAVQRFCGYLDGFRRFDVQQVINVGVMSETLT